MEQPRRTTTLRLRRVRFKDGRAPIEVIRQRSVQEERSQVMDEVRATLEAHEGHISGFAFVVWGPDAASTAQLRSYDTGVPRIMVPKFVEERLHHEIGERWTRQGLRDDGVI